MWDIFKDQISRVCPWGSYVYYSIASSREMFFFPPFSNRFYPQKTRLPLRPLLHLLPLSFLPPLPFKLFIKHHLPFTSPFFPLPSPSGPLYFIWDLSLSGDAASKLLPGMLVWRMTAALWLLRWLLQQKFPTEKFMEVWSWRGIEKINEKNSPFSSFSLFNFPVCCRLFLYLCTCDDSVKTLFIRMFR